MTSTSVSNQQASDVLAGKAAGRPAAADAPAPEEAGKAPSQHYQDGLDESLEETFPASDPIAPGVSK